jgi:hypothetical protein
VRSDEADEGDRTDDRHRAGGERDGESEGRQPGPLERQAEGAGGVLTESEQIQPPEGEQQQRYADGRGGAQHRQVGGVPCVGAARQPGEGLGDLELGACHQVVGRRRGQREGADADQDQALGCDGTPVPGQPVDEGEGCRAADEGGDGQQRVRHGRQCEEHECGGEARSSADAHDGEVGQGVAGDGLHDAAGDGEHGPGERGDQQAGHPVLHDDAAQQVVPAAEQHGGHLPHGYGDVPRCQAGDEQRAHRSGAREQQERIRQGPAATAGHGGAGAGQFGGQPACQPQEDGCSEESGDDACRDLVAGRRGDPGEQVGSEQQGRSPHRCGGKQQRVGADARETHQMRGGEPDEADRPGDGHGDGGEQYRQQDGAQPHLGDVDAEATGGLVAGGEDVEGAGQQQSADQPGAEQGQHGQGACAVGDHQGSVPPEEDGSGLHFEEHHQNRRDAGQRQGHGHSGEHQMSRPAAGAARDGVHQSGGEESADEGDAAARQIAEREPGDH